MLVSVNKWLHADLKKLVGEYVSRDFVQREGMHLTVLSGVIWCFKCGMCMDAGREFMLMFFAEMKK